MNQTPSNSDAAREGARQGDGKFGNQVHGLPSNGLDRDTPEFYDYLIEEELPPGTPAGWQGARVHAANGKTFNVRFIPQGSAYGLTHSLVANMDIVEFYDVEHMHTPHGQFTGGRYRVETLLGTDGFSSGKGGLDLYGGEPEWTIDATAMSDVREWLKSKTQPNQGETK